MRILIHRFFAIVILSILANSVSTQNVEAIPAFARKYETSCTTCHTVIPKRNAFGEAFRRNGYIMPVGDNLLIEEDPVSLGARGWKALFPDAVWPGLLPGNFPLSAYAHQRVVADLKNDNYYFDMPHELELIFGGTFGERMAFFGEWIAFEKGEDAKGLKRFFFQFNDLLGPRNLINLRAGRFEPGITDGYTDSNRITLEHVLTLDYMATGKWRPRDQQSGIEVNGIFKGRFNYAVGLVNGESITIDDATDEKDYYCRISYKLGGLRLDGILPDQSTDLVQSGNWSDNGLTFGIYAYQGNYLAPNSMDNDFSRIGFDFHGNYNRLDIFAGAITGTDNNPNGLVTGTIDEMECNSLAWFAEGQYMIYPWLVGSLRIGNASSSHNNLDLDDITVVLPNLTLLAQANVRFSVEALFRKAAGGDLESQWLKINAMFVF